MKGLGGSAWRQQEASVATMCQAGGSLVGTGERGSRESDCTASGGP